MAEDKSDKSFAIVVAMTLDGGIGYKSKLPWVIPKDLKLFAALTTRTQNKEKRNAVIMGRNTFSSLPKNCQPLTNRLNVIVSGSLLKTQEACWKDAVKNCKSPVVVSTLQEALQLCWQFHEDIETSFVIGGCRLYKEALCFKELNKIFVTRVVGEPLECDVYVPELTTLKGFLPVSLSPTFCHKTWAFDFIEYNKEHGILNSMSPDSKMSPIKNDIQLPSLLNEIFSSTEASGAKIECTLCCPTIQNRIHPEFQYTDLIRNILLHGEFQQDRTGVGTYFLFGSMMRFDLGSSFPLLTTKNVFFRGVVEELLWFLRGSTNANTLSTKGVKIWDANGTREFLDSQGFFERDVGDLGPVYGFQWRHFGASYTSMYSNYEGQGIDQLQNCISLIRNNPTSRRIILTAWNPCDIPKMVLPPCHLLAQFSVSNDKRLSCILYQRSADMGLGVPFNIASYSLLTCVLANICDLERGEFIHVLGNTHVYQNHVEPLKKQLSRLPRPFPLLKILRKLQSIDDLTEKDIRLIGYHPHPRIPMEMAV